MSTKDEVRDFLVSRRANLTPERAGLPDVGERRVPGLRREEVALLANISLDYYKRIERGHLRGISDSVLASIARALQLNDAEREYLFDLARTAPAASPRARQRRQPSGVRTSVQRVLDNLRVPAIVFNAHQDLVAANLMGRALYAPHFDTDGTPNIVRFIFLDPRAADFYVDLPLARAMSSAMLRLEAGRDPLNEDLTALIGELSTRSPRFRTDWAGHNVHEHRHGVKAFRHPEVGLVDVVFDVFAMPGETGLQIVTYSAPPGSDTADKFALLEAWAATREAEAPEADPANADTEAPS